MTYYIKYTFKKDWSIWETTNDLSRERCVSSAKYSRLNIHDTSWTNYKRPPSYYDQRILTTDEVFLASI